MKDRSVSSWYFTRGSFILQENLLPDPELLNFFSHHTMSVGLLVPEGESSVFRFRNRLVNFATVKDEVKYGNLFLTVSFMFNDYVVTISLNERC